jgi:hypothetical protein
VVLQTNPPKQGFVIALILKKTKDDFQLGLLIDIEDM